jgi:thioredoxin reductase
MPMPASNTLAIIGAGPIGLEAAAAALDHGFDVHVFEQGEVGSHPLAWGHVRMFTPWRTSVGEHARARLEAAGWAAPDPEACPTGLEFVERYLQPLARLAELKDRVHTFAQVVQASRSGLLRDEEVGDGRRARPFRLLVRDPGGRESYLHAFTLLDASGVYAHPCWAGSGGMPARSELYLRPQMAYHLDDVLGLDREKYAGRRTLLIGDGTYAAISLDALARLADEVPGTSVAWATRAPRGALFPRAAADPLPARRALGERARALAAGTHAAVTHLGDVEVEGFEFNSATHRYRVALRAGEDARVEEVDRVLVHTGYAPDESLGRELRADDPQYFVLGHKASGGTADFLLESGYRQADDVVAWLARDVRAGAAVR